MTRSINVTPKTTLRSRKSEAYITIIKDSARVIILLRLTTDGHEASRGLAATAVTQCRRATCCPSVTLVLCRNSKQCLICNVIIPSSVHGSAIILDFQVLKYLCEILTESQPTEGGGAFNTGAVYKFRDFRPISGCV